MSVAKVYVLATLLVLVVTGTVIPENVRPMFAINC